MAQIYYMAQVNGLKYSVADWCFLKGTDPFKYYSGLKAAGFDHAETVQPSHFQAARDAGVKILNTDAPGKADGVNKMENHPKLLPEIADAIKLAADSGIPHLIVFGGEKKGQDVREGLENCVTAFKTLAREAEKQGVVMVFEMISTLEIPDNLATSSAFGFELARRVDSPAFKTLYDVYHMTVMGEDAAADIGQNVDLIGHIHLSQIPGMTSPISSGPVVFEKVVQRAVSAGYEGYWGLEFQPACDSVTELMKARELLDSYIK